MVTDSLNALFSLWISSFSDLNVHAGPVDTAFIVDQLSYKSPYADELLVEDLSLKISQGAHLLVVGNTGTGKTSLLRVLNRLWEAQSGEWASTGSGCKKRNWCFHVVCLLRLCPDDHMLRTQRNPFPAAETIHDRRDPAWAGRFSLSASELFK